MTGLPTELVYILLFGALLLFNFVMQRAARRRQAEQGPEEPLADEIPEEIWSRVQTAAMESPASMPLAAPRQRAEAPRVVAAPARRRYGRQALLGDRRRIQDAFVVATILGRCRADEPHEVR